MRYLLGIDIGTTSVKTVLIDTAGRILANASTEISLRSTRPGWAEEDPEEWWGAVCATVPECLSRAGVRAGEISAVGASGMVPALVLLDREGRVVRLSIQQNDARAAGEIDELKRQTDVHDVLQRTGSPITQQSIGPKLLWLRRYEPDSMRRAARLMGSYDFIAYRLTGSCSYERNWALESGLFDLIREDWGDDLLRLSTIDRSWLGPVHSASDLVGQVTSGAARVTGLRSGTPVVAGSADHVASAFSAGVVKQGDLLVKLGGAGDILYCIDRPEVNHRLFLDYHVIPGKFLMNGCMAASGSIVRWFRERFAPGVEYRALDSEAAVLPAGSDGLILLPYFLGEKTPIHDPLARGTLVGLTLAHTRAHVYRAIMEGIAYGFCHHIAVMAERGPVPTRARVTNGGAQSGLWRQITADVLGIQLELVAHHPGSSLGAAFVAGMGVGAFSEWDQIGRFIEVTEITEPDAQNHTRYQHFFRLYREIYEALRDTFPRLTMPGEERG